MSLHNSNRTMSSLEALYKDLNFYVKESTLNYDEKLPMVLEEDENSNRSGIESVNIPKRQCSWQDYKKKRQKDISDAIVMSLHTIQYQNSIAFMSEVVKNFIKRIHELCQSRDIFCSTEYPDSFTGEEAVNTLYSILLCDWPRKEYRQLARSLLRIEPPFITQVTYSERSVQNNTLYDSSNEVYTLIPSDTAPQGLLLPLLDCYSPLCIAGLSNGCYAPTCPNSAKNRAKLMQSPRNSIINIDLQRTISVTSSLASSIDTCVSRAWSANIPREILQKTSTKEIKRQEAINEFIYTEEDYIRDLNLLDDVFAKPLLISQCIPEEMRRVDTYKKIFGNYLTLIDIHQQLYHELRNYQLYCQETVNGFIDEIGVILLKYISQFSDAYISYGSHFISAEYQVKKEMAHNDLFHDYIREKEKYPETRKLPFRHFIILPIIRLQRYPLLLEAILKRTDDHHSDKAHLIKVIKMIKEIASRMNKRTREIEQKLHLKEINDCIRFKPGKPTFDLHLDKPKRTLIYEGLLKRRKHLGVETSDLYVFLFDHLLLMTKKTTTTSARKSSGDHGTLMMMDVFTVSKNPIPLNLLNLKSIPTDSSVIGTIKSLTGSSSHSLFDTTLIDNNIRPKSSSTSSSTTLAEHQQNGTNQTLLTIQHLGRHGGDYVLSANSPNAQYVWREKILYAKREWDKKQTPAFEITSMSEFTFAQTGQASQHGRVTCSTRFVGSNGEWICVIGTQRGIFAGPENSVFKCTLSTNDVTQLAAIPSHGMMVVLADKVLKAYPISYFDPNASRKVNVFKVISNHSVFFSTGTCNDKTFIITMKKKGIDSHFKAHEVICGDLTDPRNSKYLAAKTSFMSKAPSWFKLYQTFYIGADCYSVHFLRSKLLVRCTHGFEVIDMNKLQQNTNLPDLSKKEYHFIPPDAQPLGIFKCENQHFLVCYDRFAFMMNTHGDRIKQDYNWMEWEGHPHSVAFYSPYVIAFDAKFIEIRHVETAKVVQVIPGENIRYLHCATRNVNTMSTLYGVMTHPFRPDYHDVFKLVPLPS